MTSIASTIMATGFCKNHPDVTVHRRCYTCGQFICTQCQLLRNRHYFCSERCHRRFLLQESLHSFFKPIKETLQPILQLLLPWFMEKAGAKKRGGLSRELKIYDLIISFVAVLLLASPLIGIAILLRQNEQLHDRLARLENLQNFASSAEKNPPPSTSAHSAFLKFDKPAQAMVTGNQITIEGEAPDGQIISLVQDNWVRAVTLPRHGRFSLPAVMLTPGQNQFVVQALGPDGEIIALEHLAITYGRPTVDYLAKDLTRGSLERKQVALTFDGGSTDNAAQQILDILRQHQLQVTIFLTGGFIEKFPEVTRRIVQDGHEVGNHTWSHPHLTTFAQNKQNETLPNMTREFLHDQLNRTARLFEEVTGKQMTHFWRAPYGEHNLQIRQWAAELGYRHIGWTRGRSWQESMDTMDWVADTNSVAYHTSEEILSHLLAMADNEAYGINGGIILMHLGSLRTNNDHFYTILPRLISSLREKSYELVKISALVE